MQPRRPIRSFVLRAGRLTTAQQRALQELWPKYGLDTADEPIDLDALFQRSAPRCLEIGFGTGEVIASLAEANPAIDYLGIDVHRSGVGRLLLRAERAHLANLRVISRDAVEVLARAIAACTLDETLIFFPDPWHKTRHHKRRLINADFVALLAGKLRAGGRLRLATDWRPYAEQMLCVCNAETTLESLSEDRTFVARPDFRPPTRFERRGERLGHLVWDLAYRKRAAVAERCQAPPKADVASRNN
ncbi:MAG TPA: tRNA (guanosine(46)-N7)-methyltransferase TrmB [Steroidobacteraceae bacterium]|nr:tRNA (guanosine(46)-N7)-methyltransferase TrmB [Steroidobacteraceae bacterium]